MSIHPQPAAIPADPSLCREAWRRRRPAPPDAPLKNRETITGARWRRSPGAPVAGPSSPFSTVAEPPRIGRLGSWRPGVRPPGLPRYVAKSVEVALGWQVFHDLADHELTVDAIFAGAIRPGSASRWRA